MCGRATSTTSATDLAALFGIDVISPGADIPPSWNVAPTQQVRTVAEHDGQRRLGTMRWGLVPFFANDLAGSARMINARGEGVATKPAYRRAFERRRCLIPMDGFYEWEKLEGKAKQPWYFQGANGQPLALAGLWEVWRDPAQLPKADRLVSCTIITTSASADVALVHDRMPVVVDAGDWSTWLDRSFTDTAELQHLIRPAPDNYLTRRRVSSQVNGVANDNPRLVDALNST